MSPPELVHSKAYPLKKHNAPAAKVSGINDLLFCSGQVGQSQKDGTRDIKKATGGVALGRVNIQVDALLRLKDVLELGGSSWADVAKYNIFLADMNDYDAMNDAFVATLPDPKPARTCVQAAKLPLNAIIEIECIASVPKAKL